MSDQYSKPFIPVIQKTSTLVRMAVMAVVVFAVAFFSRVEIISETYETKVNAAGQMAKAMEMLKEVRLEKGVFVDVENDPNETGLVGSQFSLTTTDEGDLDAKLTTLDPNFSAAMVELLHQAKLQSGDSIAVMLTGSMPGANMAMLIACDAMNIHPVVITSIGASQWGANDPDMTWLDMEKLLFENGFISTRSIAASIGGRNDQGRLLSPKGRELITDNISEHGMPLIKGEGLRDNIQKRMVHFGNNNYKAVVNVGGGVASLGTSFNLRLLPPGVVYRNDIEAISRKGGIEGTVVKFVKQNMPLIHVLNIQKLTENLGMPFAPIPLPEIGLGSLYAIHKYNLNITFICLLIIAGMVIGVGWKSHQQIKQRMMEHEPDSVL
jgi:poly-gamma-glutamate system protein